MELVTPEWQRKVGKEVNKFFKKVVTKKILLLATHKVSGGVSLKIFRVKGKNTEKWFPLKVVEPNF